MACTILCPDGIYPSWRDKILPQPLTDKCIILDVDETMVHTDEDMHNISRIGIFDDSKAIDIRHRIYNIRDEDITGDRGAGNTSHLWGISRPYIKEFLVFCFSYFRVVAIWSAGQKRYVENIVNFLTHDVKSPHIIYTREDCRKDGTLLTKPIQYMAEKASHLNMNASNTIIVDDRDTVFSTCNPNNGILIPEYEPDKDLASLAKDEHSLVQLMYWLSLPGVRYAPDVTLVDKSNIFTIPVHTYRRSVNLPINLCS